MSILYYLYYKINYYFNKNKEEINKKNDKNENQNNYFEKLL